MLPPSTKTTTASLTAEAPNPVRQNREVFSWCRWVRPCNIIRLPSNNKHVLRRLWLHVISSYAISTAAISTVHTFNRSHFQPLVFSTACKFNRHKFDLFNSVQGYSIFPRLWKTSKVIIESIQRHQ